jgi:hypothetical protein
VETVLDQRAQLVGQTILAVYLANGDVPPSGDDLEKLTMAWDTVMKAVPTQHIESILAWIFANRVSDYPLKPFEIASAWADRYEEPDDPPPPHYSWAKDEHGNYLPDERDPRTGRFPFGCDTVDSERKRNIAERDLFIERKRAEREWEGAFTQLHGFSPELLGEGPLMLPEGGKSA